MFGNAVLGLPRSADENAYVGRNREGVKYSEFRDIHAYT